MKKRKRIKAKMQESSPKSCTLYQKDGVYHVKYGSTFKRVGKLFSSTFWRTQIGEDIFWSVQGCDNNGVWVVTKYFGHPGHARKFQQQITLTHPTFTKIRITYAATCEDTKNDVQISKCILNSFKNSDNTFNFEFGIVRLQRNPYPQRMF